MNYQDAVSAARYGISMAREDWNGEKFIFCYEGESDIQLAFVKQDRCDGVCPYVASASDKEAEWMMVRPPFGHPMESAEDATFALNSFAKDVHDNAVTKGFWEAANYGEKIALVTSELSESLEAMRKGEPALHFVRDDKGILKPDGVAVEVIDAIIRCLDICGHYGWDVEGLLRAKHSYNLTRPFRHGRAF